MKNRVSGLLIALAAFAAALGSSASSQAAQGQLYSGGLGDHAVYRFTNTTPPTRSTFFSGTTANAFDALAFDSKGNLFVSDTQSNTIIKLTPAGLPSTFATNIHSMGLAFDSAGNLFSSDTLTNSVARFTPAGVRTTFVSGLGGPFGVAFDPSGNLFVSLTGSQSIIKITPAKAQSTIAMGLSSPNGLVTDAAGNIYEADFGTGNIFKFAPAGVPPGVSYTMSTFGTVLFGGISAGPRQLTFDRNGNLFVASFVDQQISKFPPAGGTPTAFAASNAGGLAVEPPTSRLGNISTRASVQTGDRVTIAGFIIAGTASKQTLVRGLGPTLGRPPFNVPGALQDPTLELHKGTPAIAFNDNWQTDPNASQIPTSPTDYRPPDTRESALLRSLAPGTYTAILAGKNSTIGNGLVEVYDLDNYSNLAELVNVSTRAFVGTGASVAIGGFISNGGNSSVEVIIRGLGPTLTQAGVPGALANPTLTLKNANGVTIASNDNWKSSQQAAIQRTNLQPPNDLESAILQFLPPANYTAILSGVSGGTGIGLVEIYKVLR